MMNVIWIVIHISLILINREIGEQKFWSDSREQKHDFLISFFEGTIAFLLWENVWLTGRSKYINE